MDRTLKALPFVLAAVLSIVLAVAANASVKHTRMQTWCNDTASYFRIPSTRNLDNLLIASVYIAPLYPRLDTVRLYGDKLAGPTQWKQYGPKDLAYLRQDFTDKCNLPS